MRRSLVLLFVVGSAAAQPSSPQPSPSPSPSPSPPPSPPPPPPPSPPLPPPPDPPPSAPDNPRPPPTVERPIDATFGRPLDPGLYLFPDGLRLRVVQTENCDFDTSVPCFGGTYQADATFRGKDERVTWSTRTATILGHSIEVARFKLIVRK